jgi:hypothetical protein
MREAEPVIVVDLFPPERQELLLLLSQLIVILAKPTSYGTYFTLMVNGMLTTYCGHSWPFLHMALPKKFSCVVPAP